MLLSPLITVSKMYVQWDRWLLTNASRADVELKQGEERLHGERKKKETEKEPLCCLLSCIKSEKRTKIVMEGK